MRTITIQVPDELVARVSHAAQNAGLTLQDFAVQAIESRAIEVESQAELHVVAQSRWAEFVCSGEAVSAEAMRSHVRSLRAGGNPSPPPARRVLP